MNLLRAYQPKEQGLRPVFVRQSVERPTQGLSAKRTRIKTVIADTRQYHAVLRAYQPKEQGLRLDVAGLGYVLRLHLRAYQPKEQGLRPSANCSQSIFSPAQGLSAKRTRIKTSLLQVWHVTAVPLRAYQPKEQGLRL